MYLFNRSWLCALGPCEGPIWFVENYQDGMIQEEYVLEHMGEILSVLRNGNVNLRWLMLQSSGSHKKLRAAVTSSMPENSSLLTLLLGVAQLENEVG